MRPKHEGNTILPFIIATISEAEKESYVASGFQLADHGKYRSMRFLQLISVNMKSWDIAAWLGNQ